MTISESNAKGATTEEVVVGTIIIFYDIVEMQNNDMKQHHTIEIFSARCPLCKHLTDEIEIAIMLLVLVSQ